MKKVLLINLLMMLSLINNLFGQNLEFQSEISGYAQTPSLNQMTNIKGIVTDPNGNVYINDNDNKSVQKYNASGKFVTKFNFNFGSYGIDINKNSELYILATNSIVLVSDTLGNLIRTINLTNPLTSVSGFALDQNENFYISNTDEYAIYKFDKTGKYLLKWGSYGTGNNQFKTADQLTTDKNNNVFVSDVNGIKKFSPTGAYVSTFIPYSTLTNGTGNPKGLKFDKNGNLYVADAKKYNVMVFDSTGTFVRQWGSIGKSNGSFMEPYGLALDKNGNVIVGDQSTQFVQKFTSTGTFIVSFGGKAIGKGQFEEISKLAFSKTSNKFFVTDNKRNEVQVFDKTNNNYLYSFNANNNLSSPSSILTDDSGYVYILSKSTNKIVKTDEDGTFIMSFGGTGNTDDKFTFLSDFAIDKNGNFYCLESYGVTFGVRKFNSNGIYQSKWGAFGTNDGQLNQPGRIRLDKDGNLIILDYQVRIQKFSTSGTFINSYSRILYNADNIVEFTLDNNGNYFIVQNDSIVKLDSKFKFIKNWGGIGFSKGKFYRLANLEFDNNGNLWVVDRLNYRLQTFKIVNVAGIESDLNSSAVSIYPQPANSKVTISLDNSIVDNDLKIDLVSISGQKVISNSNVELNFNNTFDLDLLNLQQGVYILKITSGSKILTKKLIIN